MPTHKSALKRLRQSKKNHTRNVETRSELKTLSQKFNALVLDKKKDEAAKMLPLVCSELDKASKRGIVHDRTASRKKSRLALKLNKIAK
ncbi:MAG TPA: 30S ribosomal protein S20 [bacterium]|nr:30S ribosomal protein S20 [bacterium]